MATWAKTGHEYPGPTKYFTCPVCSTDTATTTVVKVRETGEMSVGYWCHNPNHLKDTKEALDVTT